MNELLCLETEAVGGVSSLGLYRVHFIISPGFELDCAGPVGPTVICHVAWKCHSNDVADYYWLIRRWNFMGHVDRKVTF